MAAPSVVTPGTPSGFKLTEGFHFRIAFAKANTVGLWAKRVKPFGLTNGDKIDITDQENTLYRTAVARALIDLTDGTLSCAYNVASLSTIRGQLMGRGNEGAITAVVQDGSTVTVFGYVSDFEPQETGDGEQPMANVTIKVTNWDPVNKVEAGPVFSEVAGT